MPVGFIEHPVLIVSAN